jgi:dipeptidase
LNIFSHKLFNSKKHKGNREGRSNMKKFLIGLVIVVMLGSVVLADCAQKEVTSAHVAPMASTNLGDTEECYKNYPKMCTAIGVGRKATVDRSVITTHSCDCGACDFRYLSTPAADWLEGSMRTIRAVPQISGGWEIETRIVNTKYAIPQVPHTYSYFRGVFGHMNERQLHIGESTIGGVSELDNPYGAFGVTELSVIAMERCTTAREAIQLMGKLAEKYGFYGYSIGESLMVGDTEEVWLFEILRPGPNWKPDPVTGIDPTGRLGCCWVAQRVPDKEVVVVPNVNRIREVNLNDKRNFMGSANIFSLAEELGLWDPTSGKPFIFNEVYSDRGANLRLWNLYRLLAPSKYDRPFTPDLAKYPFSFKPDKKLSVWDIVALYRDNGEETEYDNTKSLAAGPWGCPVTPVNPTANYFVPVPGCEYTVINQARDWLPDPIGGISWFGPDMGTTSVFVPFYCGINKLPESYSTGNHWKFSRNSAWWAFNFVSNWANLMYSPMIKDICETQFSLESGEKAMTPVIDKKALRLYRKDSSLVADFLTEYCINNANKVVTTWWDLADYLICQYDDGGIGIYGEMGIPSPPECWIEAVSD